MAYGNKYSAKLYTQHPTNMYEIYLYIQEKDYVGSITPIKVSFDSLAINRDFVDLDQNILGINVEFSIENNNADFFTLFDLMIATEGKYKIIIQYYESKVLLGTVFEGFINTDAVEQGYLNYQKIRVVASSYLSKLQYYHPPSLDTLQEISMIDVILDMLNEIGSTSSVYINSSLMPTQDYTVQTPVQGTDGYSLFDKCGFFTELFWDNNVERKTSYEVLESILKITNCYIYWWNNVWYIEHYNDFWKTSKYFVQYSQGSSYDPFNPGTWSQEQVQIVTDIHDLVFTNTTQLLTVTPGCKKVIIKINDDRYDNLVPGILDPFYITSLIFPDIKRRKWFGFELTYPNDYIDWQNINQPYKDIEYAVKKYNKDPTAYMNGGSPPSDFHLRGLYINFGLSVLSDTAITLSWKYNYGEGFTPPSDGNDPLFIQTYGLRFINVPGSSEPDLYLVDNREGTDGDSYPWYFVTSYGAHTSGLAPTISKHYSEFDEKTGTVEFSVTIDLFDIITGGTHGITGVPITITDKDMIVQLCIGEVGWASTLGQPLASPRFGDISIKVSGNELENNYIEGTINTDFLNTKEISVDLADLDYTYKNSILRGGSVAEPFSELTTLWESIFGDTALPIVDRLLQDKFRFYNQTRQQIKGNIHDYELWRPLSLFQDSKQSNKKFVLMGYSHRISIAAYDMILLEYDNETVVTLT